MDGAVHHRRTAALQDHAGISRDHTAVRNNHVSITLGMVNSGPITVHLAVDDLGRGAPLIAAAVKGNANVPAADRGVLHDQLSGLDGIRAVAADHNGHVSGLDLTAHHTDLCIAVVRVSVYIIPDIQGTLHAGDLYAGQGNLSTGTVDGIAVSAACQRSVGHGQGTPGSNLNGRTVGIIFTRIHYQGVAVQIQHDLLGRITTDDQRFSQGNIIRQLDHRLGAGGSRLGNLVFQRCRSADLNRFQLAVLSGNGQGCGVGLSLPLPQPSVIPCVRHDFAISTEVGPDTGSGGFVHRHGIVNSPVTGGYSFGYVNYPGVTVLRG